MTITREERIYTAQKTLRGTLLDGARKVSDPSLRNLSHELLLYLDCPEKCWLLATGYLRDRLGVERVDGGYSSPADMQYRPGQAESVVDAEEIPSLAGVMVNNSDIGVRRIWQARHPIVFRSLLEDASFGKTLLRDLRRTGASTKIATALRDEHGPIGLLCADRVNRGSPEWNTGQYDLFADTTGSVLGPILGAARRIEIEYSEQFNPAALQKLTKAEMRVAMLASQGLSYKEIARNTGRSVYTIDHHLRNIRGKLGIDSHAKLTSFMSQHNFAEA